MLMNFYHTGLRYVVSVSLRTCLLISLLIWTRVAVRELYVLLFLLYHLMTES